MTRKYLGDGVYVDFDGYQVELTTSDGVKCSNTIYLDADTLNAFMAYVQALAEAKTKRNPRVSEEG